MKTRQDKTRQNEACICTRQDTAIEPAKYSTASKSIFKAPLLKKIRDTNWSRTRGAEIAARARRTDCNYRARRTHKHNSTSRPMNTLLKTCYKQNITWLIFTTWPGHHTCWWLRESSIESDQFEDRAGTEHAVFSQDLDLSSTSWIFSRWLRSPSHALLWKASTGWEPWRPKNEQRSCPIQNQNAEGEDSKDNQFKWRSTHQPVNSPLRKLANTSKERRHCSTSFNPSCAHLILSLNTANWRPAPIGQGQLSFNPINEFPHFSEAWRRCELSRQRLLN